MKKLRLLIVLIVIALISIGCNATSCDGCFGNKTQVDFTKTYDWIYVKVSYDDTWEKYHIQQWREYGTNECNQVQVKLDDGTILLFTNVPYILVRGNGFEFEFEGEQNG